MAAIERGTFRIVLFLHEQIAEETRRWTKRRTEHSHHIIRNKNEKKNKRRPNEWEKEKKNRKNTSSCHYTQINILFVLHTVKQQPTRQWSNSWLVDRNSSRHSCTSARSALNCDRPHASLTSVFVGRTPDWIARVGSCPWRCVTTGMWTRASKDSYWEYRLSSSRTVC